MLAVTFVDQLGGLEREDPDRASTADVEVRVYLSPM